MSHDRRLLAVSLLLLLIASLSYCGGGGAQDPPRGPLPTTSTAVGYVANTKANTVSSFLLDETNGALVPVTTAATGTTPGYPAITPDRRFLYVSNTADGTISRYTLDGSGGMQSAGSATHLVSQTAQPYQILVSANGRFLLVGTTGGIEVFQIDSQNGNLAAVPGSPFVTQSKTTQIALTHSEQFLFAAGSDSSAINVFAVNTTTGAVNPLGSATANTGYDPARLEVDSSDKYLFATTYHAEKLLLYSIGSNGDLHEAAGSGVNIGLGAFSTSFANNLLYMTVLYENEIRAFKFDSSSGVLTEVAGSPFHDGQTPSCLAVSPKGGILVACRINPGHIATYAINRQTGSLSSISGNGYESGMETGNSPNNVILVPK